MAPRQDIASDRWWDDYNLGLMGVRTGSIASQLGMQHRRPQTWEKPAPVIVPKKPSAAAPGHHAPAATLEGDGKLLRCVGNGLVYLFGLLGLVKIPQIVVANSGACTL